MHPVIIGVLGCASVTILGVSSLMCRRYQKRHVKDSFKTEPGVDELATYFVVGAVGAGIGGSAALFAGGLWWLLAGGLSAVSFQIATVLFFVTDFQKGR